MALTAGAQTSTSTGSGGTTSAGTDADSSKVNANERQYDGRSGMAVFTIAKGGLMYEATLGRLFNCCLLKVAYSLLLIDHRKVDINIR